MFVAMSLVNTSESKPKVLDDDVAVPEACRRLHLGVGDSDVCKDLGPHFACLCL